jgi:TonB family protein
MRFNSTAKMPVLGEVQMNLTDTEQTYYSIAVVVSLILHFFLLAINLPGILALNNPGLETFPVGLVELASGLPAGEMVSLPKNPDQSVAVNRPGNRQPLRGANELKTNLNPNRPLQNAAVPSQKEADAVSGNPVERSGDKSVSGNNIGEKTNINPYQPFNDASVPPKKEEIAASDHPAGKTGNQNLPGGSMEKVTGSGNSRADEPQNFGTGEEMVTALAMPAYPPKVLKEGKEGNVMVRILVNAGGGLSLAIITKSSGDLRLDHAAIASIQKQWKFKAMPKGYYIDVVFSFSARIGASVRFLNAKTR